MVKDDDKKNMKMYAKRELQNGKDYYERFTYANDKMK